MTVKDSSADEDILNVVRKRRHLRLVVGAFNNPSWCLPVLLKVDRITVAVQLTVKDCRLAFAFILRQQPHPVIASRPVAQFVRPGYTTAARPGLAGGYHRTNRCHDDEHGRHVPGEHHRDDHHLVVVVLVPLDGARQRVVQQEPGLPEPRALEKDEKGSAEGNRYAVTVTHLKYGNHDVEVDYVEKKCMNEDIELRTTMEMEHEEHGLNNKCQCCYQVFDTRW